MPLARFHDVAILVGRQGRQALEKGGQIPDRRVLHAASRPRGHSRGLDAVLDDPEPARRDPVAVRWPSRNSNQIGGLRIKPATNLGIRHSGQEVAARTHRGVVAGAAFHARGIRPVGRRRHFLRSTVDGSLAGELDQAIDAGTVGRIGRHVDEAAIGDDHGDHRHGSQRTQHADQYLRHARFPRWWEAMLRRMAGQWRSCPAGLRTCTSTPGLWISDRRTGSSAGPVHS